jgi:hypothetical protein
VTPVIAIGRKTTINVRSIDQRNRQFFSALATSLEQTLTRRDRGILDDNDLVVDHQPDRRSQAAERHELKVCRIFITMNA